ncbi:hypothetical protein BDW67DRAFT_165339 [Aspergillus spinulosporus]
MAFLRLLSISSTRELKLDALRSFGTMMLLLVRENIARPLRGLAPSTFLLFALVLGHSALQLMDRLSPEESWPALADVGVWGEDDRRLAKRGCWRSVTFTAVLAT